jgi:hypothetical protein
VSPIKIKQQPVMISVNTIPQSPVNHNHPAVQHTAKPERKLLSAQKDVRIDKQIFKIREQRGFVKYAFKNEFGQRMMFVPERFKYFDISGNSFPHFL